jgi:peptidoglycan/LPS O-acetylase OafA/YrhL
MAHALPQKSDRLPFLDALRGVAILGVFLFHAMGSSFGQEQLRWSGLVRDFGGQGAFPLMLPVTFGWAGVAVFFVVSGFCIHLSHLSASRGGLKVFFVRRFFRIFPPYLLSLSIFFFLPPWRHLSIATFRGLAQLAIHAAGLQNLDSRALYGVNPSFWSIAVEIQLYAIYPLLLACARRLGWRNALLLTAAVEIGIRTVQAALVLRDPASASAPHPAWLFESPFAYWFSWSLGACLADAWHGGRAVPFRKLPLVPTLAAAVAAGFFSPAEPFGFTLFAAATAGICARFLSSDIAIPDAGAGAPFWRHLSFLGTVSYSFYLFHQPIVGLMPWISALCYPSVLSYPFWRFGACLALYAPILLLSYGSYRLVERPSIRAGKRAIARM